MKQINETFKRASINSFEQNIYANGSDGVEMKTRRKFTTVSFKIITLGRNKAKARSSALKL